MKKTLLTLVALAGLTFAGYSQQIWPIGVSKSQRNLQVEVWKWNGNKYKLVETYPYIDPTPVDKSYLLNEETKNVMDKISTTGIFDADNYNKFIESASFFRGNICVNYNFGGDGSSEVTAWFKILDKYDYIPKDALVFFIKDKRLASTSLEVKTILDEISREGKFDRYRYQKIKKDVWKTEKERHIKEEYIVVGYDFNKDGNIDITAGFEILNKKRDINKGFASVFFMKNGAKEEKYFAKYYSSTVGIISGDNKYTELYYDNNGDGILEKTYEGEYITAPFPNMVSIHATDVRRTTYQIKKYFDLDGDGILEKSP